MHLPQSAVVDELKRVLHGKQNEIDENLHELKRLRTVVPDTKKYKALCTRVSRLDIGDFWYEDDAECKLDKVQNKYDTLKTKCDELIRKIEAQKDLQAKFNKAQDDLDVAREKAKEAEYKIVKEKTQAFLKYNTLNT